jgi:hypothetical protein
MPAPWAEQQVPTAWVMAAKKGCAQCHGRVTLPHKAPKAPPFSQGPNVGLYLCMECWVLVWKDSPTSLADDDTRKFVALEASRILLKREGSVLFQDGQVKVYRSTRGTVVFDLPSKPDLAPNEYDPDRLAALLKAVKGLAEKSEAPSVAIPVQAQG